MSPVQLNIARIIKIKDERLGRREQIWGGSDKKRVN